MNIDTNNRRKIFIILCLMGVVLLLGFAIFKITTLGKNKLVVSVAPKDAYVYINGAKGKTGTTYLSPGKYDIKITRNGFENYSRSLMAEKGKTTLVTTVLKPNSQEGVDYEKAHEDDFLAVAKKTDAELATNNAYFSGETANKYPLTEKLPIDKYPLYSIDFGQSKKHPEDKSRIAIYIKSPNPAGKQYALMDIYSMGFDPSDYEIIFLSMKVDLNEVE